MECKEAAIRLKQFEDNIGKYLNEAAQALKAQQDALEAQQQALAVQQAQQLLFSAAVQQAAVHVNALRQLLKEHGIVPPN